MNEPYDESNSFLKARGIQFHYALDSKADSGSADPVLVLVNMASANLTTWEPVMGALLKNFRILRFDIRGTGKNGGPVCPAP